ncbi:MAG: glycosyltransferase family 2 protein [Anaerolineae bacterium]|nr:glycosyltransferase family 2 protein [Gloeobacterales cyanobacterium ES-bin-313]
MSPLVHILVLNWNAYSYTIECVHSLRRLKYANYRIVLIDNGSTDNSEQILHRELPDLPLLQTGANLGYAGGNNCGINYALEHGADYIWILNNDTRVDSNSLTALVDALERNPDAALAGSKIFYMDRSEHLAYAGADIDYLRGKLCHRGVNEIDNGQYDKLEAVDFVTGCSLLVRASLIEKVGLMSEDFFLYCEDVEWNLRFQKAGFICLYVPSSRIWHKESGSAGGPENPNVVYYGARNRLYLFERHFPLLSRTTATVRYSLWHIKYLVTVYLQERKRFGEVFSAVSQGYRDYVARVVGCRPQRNSR